MLGLENLSDDQLLAMLRTVCREHGRRRLSVALKRALPAGSSMVDFITLLTPSEAEILSGLGLDRLAPEDLIQLRAEVVLEVSNRDEIVGGLARTVVLEELDRLHAEEKAVPKAIESAQADYRRMVARETSEAIRAAVNDGSLSLLTSAEEANVVVKTTLETKIALIDEAVSGIKAGNKARFYFEVTPGAALLVYGSRRFEYKGNLTPEKIYRIAQEMRAVLG